ncbi:hypothetical protein [Streptomyces sp. NPDC001404]|uniref:hypothetical protein n=1 Tax=Streptomyces sp. NPDC001404 TaxID=3364571 RepID=UPI0036996A7D
MATAALQRSSQQPVLTLASTHEAVPPAAMPELYGHERALDALLFAVRRMNISATDRQVAALLGVAERHLLPPEPLEETFPHGTMRGYRRHRARQESACPPCREACRLESAARRKRSRVERPCGTEAAYHRHLRRWEEPCGACREAHSAYVRNYRSRRAVTAAA